MADLRNDVSKGKVIVYGHRYCSQAGWLKCVLNKNRVDYEWRDVHSADAGYADELRSLTGGYLSVPTVIFPDGSVMVEPWPGQVLQELGISNPGVFQRLANWFTGSSHE